MQQTIYSQPTISRPGTGTWNSVRNLMRMVVHLVRCIHRRNHLVTLSRMSTSELADIGLRPDDLHESASLGLGQDVTGHLANIARQRRISVRYGQSR